MRRKSIFTILMIFAVFITITVNQTPIAYAADTEIGLIKTADYTQRATGETITFDIQYSVSSIHSNATNFEILDTLPDTMEYISVEVGNSNHIDSVTQISDTQILFDMADPFPAGTTGTIKVMARFKPGVTPDGTVGVNTVEASADDADTVTDTASVTAVTSDTNWSIEKVKIVPGTVDPVPGHPVEYRITINGNDSDGLDMENVRVVDTLPNDVTVIEISDGGTQVGNTIEWNIGDLPAATSVNRYITISYNEPAYDTSSTATNQADAYGTEFGDTTELQISDSVTHGFDVETPSNGSAGEGTSITKSNRNGQNMDEYSVGQTAIFYIDNVNNTGNVALDNFYIQDDIPAELDLMSINTGRTSSGQNVNIQYITNLDSVWTDWGAASYATSSNQTLQVSALSLASDEHVTSIRWNYGTVDAGFSLSERITIRAEVLANNWDDNSAVTGAVNTAYLYSEYAGNPLDVLQDDAQLQVGIEKPWYDPIKSSNKDTVKYYTTDEPEEDSQVVFTLQVKNHDFATGNLLNPTAIDVLPIYINPDDSTDYEEIMDIISWDWGVGNTSLDKAAIEPTYTGPNTLVVDGKDRQVLKWEFDDASVVLAPGEYVEIYLTVRIKTGVFTGTYTNDFYMTNPDYDTADGSLQDDVDDLNQDGAPLAKLATNTDDIFVLFRGSLESSKWVQGELDSQWMRYNTDNPGTGSTLPGGIADYQLRIETIEANGPITNMVVIDILPYLGDTGLIDTSPRGTQWVPYLVDEITGESGIPLPSEAVVYYSTNTSLSLDELYDPENSDGQPSDGWTTTPPDDITTVKAVKVDFNDYVFTPGETMIIEWPMRAPVEAPHNEIAWNSFAYNATYPGFLDGNEIQKPFAAAEPIKVGFSVEDEDTHPYNLGDFVWHDANANGIQEAGEEGINGVIVNLYDSTQTVGVDDPIAWTRTGESHINEVGYYQFPNLAAGDYIVEFIYPEGYFVSPDGAGTSSTDSDVDDSVAPVFVQRTDSQGNVTNHYSVHTDVVTLGPDNLDIDLGLYEVVSLGDRVWRDSDADGIQESGEIGVQGVTVTLTDTSGNPVNDNGGTLVSPVVTDADGLYSFTNLTPGEYRVTFSNLPAGYDFSDSHQGDDEFDSDASTDPLTLGQSHDIDLMSRANDITIDAGIHAAMLGDYVWLDLDRDNIQTGSGQHLSGVTVTLLDGLGNPAVDIDGNAVASQTTGTDGEYLFADLAPGDYIVQFALPIDSGDTVTDYMFVDAFAGSDTSIDSNVDSVLDYDTGVCRTASVTLAAAEINLTVDAGVEYKPSSLGDFVWEDMDGDGRQDSETGIENITVTLTDTSGNSVLDIHQTVVPSQLTDANGAYLFDNLEPGTYVVEFRDTTNTYIITRRNRDGDSQDSDATNQYVQSYGESHDVTLGPNEHDPTVDAGMYEPGSISNFVWLDVNYNGIQDVGEVGVEGVAVELRSSNGSSLYSTTTTDVTGQYLFDDLRPRGYTIDFDLTDLITNAGQDYVFVPANSGADDGVDSDANQTTGRTSSTTILSGEHDATWDAGIVEAASIGDIVWLDVNRNGIQDAGETGVSGITVNLLDSSGNATGRTTTTDSSGNYLFDFLLPGSYIVEFDIFDADSDYLFTDKESGSDTAVDSNVNTDDTLTSYGRSDIITVGRDEENMTIDAGLVYKAAAIGNYAWVDTNGNGIQDAGESPLAGITVTLTDSAGNSVNDIDGNPVDPQTTLADGLYKFENLEPQQVETYVVNFSDGSGIYEITLSDSGSDNAVDSDADRVSGDTATISVDPGEYDDSWDAGFYIPVDLGDYVWVDTNGNGQQDAVEAGIGGVTVTLTDASGNTVYDKNGAAIPSQVTNASGAYLFTDLIPGDYKVEFDLSTLTDSTYKFVTKDASGVLDADDSDANIATGITDTITLLSGIDDLTIDAGIARPVSLGDYVWLDVSTNQAETRNGLQDAGENGVAGIDVYLVDAAGNSVTDMDGNAVAAQTTGADGLYKFDNLLPGTYKVRFDLGTNPDYEFTARGDGTTAPATDSNVYNNSADAATYGYTETVTLNENHEDITLDAGLLYLPASIGNYVWLDNNGNGIQDAGESALAGITVTLTDDSGNPVRDINGNIAGEQITLADGSYLFDDLEPVIYDYIVTFEDTTGTYEFTLQNVGANDAADSDSDRTTGESHIIDLVPKEYDQTIDAGMYVPASLGDYVWVDTNGNGIQDAGESGVENVTVRLLNSSGATQDATTTNSSGLYSFNNIIPGDYIVEFVLPVGYAFTTEGQGADIADSDASATNGRSAVTSLTSGENDNTWDAGILRLVDLGDRVWLDADRDGVQDAGENGVAGVTVRLLDSSGTTLDTTTTDANGDYLFADIMPGTYMVEFVAPAAYLFTDREQDSDTAADSNAYANGRTDQIVLTEGNDNLTIDAGLVYKSTSLGDYVWLDVDGDGVQDTGENGLAGVTVSLRYAAGGQVTDINGNTVADQTTPADGSYLFDDLEPEDYVVAFAAPAGYEITLQDAGGDDTADSDADRSTGETISINLSPDEHDMTWDAGFYETVSLGDFVWTDTNGDGVQEAGENGIENVIVNLLEGSTGSAVLATTTTDANGAYLFDNLKPGDYRVEFDLTNISSDYVFVPGDAGADDAADSDVISVSTTTGNGTTDTVTLQSGERDMTWDAGVTRPVDLGDKVWLDLDRDGIQDAGEDGVAGITVRLLDSTGALTLETTITDANGNYLFEDVFPGSYIVEFDISDASSPYLITGKNAGADTAVDSNANSNGRTDVFALTDGNDDMTIDAGLVYKPSSIGDLVWRDTNLDGLQDAGENGIAGVTVRLYETSDMSSHILETTTDANGNYLFSTLNPGDYVVEVVVDEQYTISPKETGGGTNADTDSDIDAITGRSDTITLGYDEDILNIDAGLHILANLGDYVWEDNNYNGVQDAGDAGVDGMIVNLLDGTGAQIGTTTTENGAYSFTDLEPGDYIVEFVLPSGYIFVNADEGSDDAIDSDADRATYRAPLISLLEGGEDITLDAGIVQAASIGNRVWLDLDRDGIQDSDSVNLENITVNLLDSTGATVLESAITDASGNYLFDELLPGTYIVEFGIDSTVYRFTSREQGGEMEDDSNAYLANGRSESITLAAGENNLSIDAGIEYLPSSIGDYVWRDTNLDGIQDIGEDGIEGIAVRLYDVSDMVNPLMEITTAADGSYLFEDLNPGDYVVEVVAGAEYVITDKSQGTDAALDSDIDTVTGLTDTITLGHEEDITDIDAGLYVLAGLGDRVWTDMNLDGIQDIDESGLAGVAVTLYDDAFAEIAATVTDVNGDYSFENLEPGTYYVLFALPAESEFTLRYQGIDDAADSNANDATGWTDAIELDDGEYDSTIDAGVIPLLSIGDRVWVDDNANGRQDGTDYGLNGIRLWLYDADTGLEVASTETVNGPLGLPGYYLFSGLRPGNYYMLMGLPGNHSVTYLDLGEEFEDNDGYRENDVLLRTEDVVLDSHSTVIDFGLIDLDKYPYWRWDGAGMINPQTGDDSTWLEVIFSIIAEFFKSIFGR